MRLNESNKKAKSHFTAFQQVPISSYPVEKNPLLPILNPNKIYLFKVNNGNSGTMSEICSKLTIKTPDFPH